MGILNGKKVLVMGLGLHQGGVSVVRYLLKHGAVVTVTDLKSKHELSKSLDELGVLKKAIHLRLGGHRASDFTHQELIFQNPGVPSTSPYLARAMKRGIQITSEAVHFMNNTKSFIIGVTGSRGKSSTCHILYKILQSSLPRERRVFLAGNIATQGLLDIIDKAGKSDIVVAELSSFHLERFDSTTKRPRIAILTALYPDHLNRYRSMKEYTAAKMKLFIGQRKTDSAIFNLDAIASLPSFRSVRSKKFFFSDNRSVVRGAYVRNATVILRTGRSTEKLLPVTVLPNNIYVDNFLAAAVALSLVGVPSRAIQHAFISHTGLPFRMQTIARYKGAHIINDSCSTSPIAAQKAIESLQGRILLIAGGVNKSLRYFSLAQAISKRAVAVILLPGSASDELRRNLRRQLHRRVKNVPTLRSATREALQVAQNYNYILFSPAAASFNQFKNEFDRGSVFNELINAELAKKG